MIDEPSSVLAVSSGGALWLTGAGPDHLGGDKAYSGLVEDGGGGLIGQVRRAGLRWRGVGAVTW
ncbi:hypothetical protein ACWD4F_27715 [Streptomyces aureus]